MKEFITMNSEMSSLLHTQ